VWPVKATMRGDVGLGRWQRVPRGERLRGADGLLALVNRCTTPGGERRVEEVTSRGVDLEGR
jgi:hypothetical protein